MSKPLAVMQNQWFHNPERVRRTMERDPRNRPRLIKYALFAGCKSGRVLRSVFGDLCDTFHWEEASREIGDRASSVFTADLDHLRKLLDEVSPPVVLAFGRVAGDALQMLVPPDRLIVGPHPTARGPNVMLQLRQMREIFEARKP